MSYKINLGEWNRIFAVPYSVADNLIKLASGDFIKVLLVLLSRADQELSNKELCDLSGVSLDNVNDAVLFWVDKGILSANESALAPSNNINTSAPFVETKEIRKQKTKKESSVKIKSNAPVRLTGSELSKRINKTVELKWLIGETEKMFGRFLTPIETSTLVSMFDYANMPADLIVMIIEYCVSIDRANLRFIEKTAYSWLDLGIDDHKKVENHITELVTNRNNESLIKTAFGIWDRNLSSKEKEFISVWMNEWEFSVEMIKLAYEMTIDNTGKLSFPYINKILIKWHDSSISTTDQAIKKENEHLKEKTSSLSSLNPSEFEDFSDYTVPDLSKKRGKQWNTQ